MKVFRAALLLAALPLRAQQPGKPPPTAAAILDRYVQITGPGLYNQCSFVSIYSTVTRADGTTFNTTTFHSRDGRTQTDIDAGSASRQSGAGNGIAWEFSEAKGARILTGKAADRELAKARGFDEDDWRIRFPTVKLIGSQVLKGAKCYQLKLTRVDGSEVERFYDERTGLLVREVSTEFDEAGVEQPTTIDFAEYKPWLGIVHASLMNVKMGNRVFTTRIDSLTYYRGKSAEAFPIPHEVARAISASKNSGSSLPDAVSLIDKFIDATGGKDAYSKIETEVTKGEISYKEQNLKFPIVVYTAGHKFYSSFDIPSLGKFESGNDGQTGWERSVMLGPKLTPRSRSGGLLSPTADEVLGWIDSGLNVETLSKDESNGSPCYQIRMGDGSTVCFDVKTGFLLKEAWVMKSEKGSLTAQTVFSDYRADAGIVTPHHMETTIGGQMGAVDVKEIRINTPPPEGIFDLPADVQALKDKRDADRKTKAADAPPRPTLRKGN